MKNETQLKRVLLLEDHVEAQAWLSDAINLAYAEQVEIEITETIADAKCLSKISYSISFL